VPQAVHIELSSPYYIVYVYEYNIYECASVWHCVYRGLWAVDVMGCGLWVVRVVNNRSNSPGCHTFWMTIKVAVK